MMGLRDKAQFLNMGLRDKANYLIKQEKAKHGLELYRCLIDELNIDFPVKLQSVIDSIISICINELFISEMIVVLKGSEDKSYNHCTFKGYSNFDGKDFQLANDHPLIAPLLLKDCKPIDLSQETGLEADDSTSNLIRRYHLNYSLAIRHQDKLLGYMFFGHREYQEPYSKREYDFMQFLSSYAAMIFSTVMECVKHQK